MPRARCVRKDPGLPCPLQGAITPASPHVHQSRSSLNFPLLDFYRSFITKAGLMESSTIDD